MCGTGWGGRCALRALACATGLLLPSAGQAQTEIEKSLPIGLPPEQGEDKKGLRAASPGRAPEPAATGWSADVSDRAVAATAADIAGDEARTRFTLVLSAGTTHPYFTLAHPHRPNG